MTVHLARAGCEFARHARPCAPPPLPVGRSQSAAGSPATPSASATASSTPREGRGSCRPRRRCSSSPTGAAGLGAAAACRRSRSCMYLTHYGRVGDVARLGAELIAGIDRLVDPGPGHTGGQPTATSGCAGRCRRCTSRMPVRMAARQGDAAVADAAGDGPEAECAGPGPVARPRAVERGASHVRSRFQAAGPRDGDHRRSPGHRRGLRAAPGARRRGGGAVGRGRRPRPGAGAIACAEAGAQALYLHCDVSNKAEVDAALAATLADFGRVRRRWSTTPASSRPRTFSTSPKPTGTR